MPFYVARYHDMIALAANAPAAVIGETAMLRDRPGFEVDFITRGSAPTEMHSSDRHHVLLVHQGHWKLRYEGGEATLAPGDTGAVPPGLSYSLEPSMTGTCSLFRVVNTDDPAGPTATDLN